jgi:hypothetical protein
MFILKFLETTQVISQYIPIALRKAFVVSRLLNGIDDIVQDAIGPATMIQACIFANSCSVFSSRLRSAPVHPGALRNLLVLDPKQTLAIVRLLTKLSTSFMNLLKPRPTGIAMVQSMYITYPGGLLCRLMFLDFI